MTRSPLMRERDMMMSSVTPSATYASSLSSPRLRRGRTANVSERTETDGVISSRLADRPPSAAPISAAVENRSAGSLANALRITESISPGRAGLERRGDGTGSMRTLASTALVVRPL